jgi:hypothetical protein
MRWRRTRCRVKLCFVSRRSSSPEIPVPPGQVHATRRTGSRKDATERVRIRRDAFQTSGWTLNISRGGARLVLEEPVELGKQYQVEMGVEAEPREVRIVWAQDEADGQIVGVQFLDGDGSVPPPPAKGRSTPPQPAKGSSAPPVARSSRPPSTDPKRSKLASSAPPKPKTKGPAAPGSKDGA